MKDHMNLESICSQCSWGDYMNPLFTWVTLDYFGIFSNIICSKETEYFSKYICYSWFQIDFFPSFINEAVLQITVFQLAVIYEAEAKISVSCKMHIKNQLGVCGSCGYGLRCSPKNSVFFCVCSNVVNINRTKKLLETVEWFNICS